MKRKLTSILLMSALLVGGASTFVSCKDYDGDQTAVLNADLAQLEKYVKENCEELKGIIDGKQDYLGDQINADLQKLHETIQKAEDAKNAADEAKAWVDANTDLNKLTAKVEALAKLADDQETLSKLAGMTSTWGEDFQNVVVKSDLLDYVKKEDLPGYWAQLEELFEKKEDMKADVTKIIDDITAANAENFTSYADLVKAFDKVPAELEALEEQMDELLAWKEDVQTTLDNMLTGVNVDMVENPYFGTLNTPFGVKSTMLIGFVGDKKIDNTELNGNKVMGAEYASSADGGTIYFTVNPSDLDIKGLKFALVGRDGTEAPGFELGAAVKDNKKVTTVGTRAAGENNGAYKAVAGITDGNKAKVTANKEDLKTVAKNVLGKLRGEENLDVTNAVRTIYSTFANAIPQYYALQAEYNVMKDGKPEQKYYTSEYNIAAVTVQPLSYETLKDHNFRDIPQIPLLQDWLNANITKFTYDPVDVSKIKDVEVEIPDINNVKVSYNDTDNPNLSGGKLTWTIDPTQGGTVSIDFSKIEVKEGIDPATGKKYSTKVTVKLDDLRQVVLDLNAQVEGMVGDVNKLFDKVENLAGSADKYINKINSLIGKANKFIDNFNQYLQPIMIAGTSDNAFRLSEYDWAPSTFKANGDNAIVLMPTSYTLELLAPAYKKSVKVNDVELNANLDGGVKTITATLKEGLNKIEYSTMDFYGYVVNKTYYINVVK